MAWCKECGTRLHDGTRMCIRCGKQLDRRQIEQVPPSVKRLTGAAIGAGLAIATLIPRVARDLAGQVPKGPMRALVVGSVLGALVLIAILVNRRRAEKEGATDRHARLGVQQ